MWVKRRKGPKAYNLGDHRVVNGITRIALPHPPVSTRGDIRLGEGAARARSRSPAESRAPGFSA